MKIYYESLNEFTPWSEAVSTFERIKDENKLEQLESVLDDLYPDGLSETDLNDLLWHEEDSVFEWLGIEESETEEETEKS